VSAAKGAEAAALAAEAEAGAGAVGEGGSRPAGSVMDKSIRVCACRRKGKGDGAHNRVSLPQPGGWS